MPEEPTEGAIYSMGRIAEFLGISERTLYRLKAEMLEVGVLWHRRKGRNPRVTGAWKAHLRAYWAGKQEEEE